MNEWSENVRVGVAVAVVTLAASIGFLVLLLKDRRRKLHSLGRPFFSRRERWFWVAIFPTTVVAILAFFLPALLGISMRFSNLWYYGNQVTNSIATVFQLRVDWGVFLIAFIGLWYRQRKQVERLGLQSQWLLNLACAMERRLPLPGYFDASAGDARGLFAGRLNQAAGHLKEGMDLPAALRKTQALPCAAIVAIEAAARFGGAQTTRVLRAISGEMRAWARHGDATLLWLVYPLALWNLLLPLMLFTTRLTTTQFSISGRLYKSPGFELFFSLAGFGAGALLLILTAIFWTAWRYSAEAPPNGFVRLILELPVLRTHRSYFFLARACRVLRELLALNVPLQDALRMASDSSLAGPHADALLELARLSESGRPLESAIDSVTLPETARGILRAGAAGNALPLAFEVAADWSELRARGMERRLRALLPAVTLLLSGLLVGSVYGSFFYSYYEVLKWVHWH